MMINSVGFKSSFILALFPQVASNSQASMLSPSGKSRFLSMSRSMGGGELVVVEGGSGQAELSMAL